MTDRIDVNGGDGPRRPAEGRRRPRLANRATLGVALTFLPTFGLLGAEAKAEPIKVKNKRSHGKGSLVDAVKRANRDRDRDKITFRSRLSGEIRLRDGLVISKPLRIDGAGARKLEIVGPRLGRTVALKTSRSKTSRIANLKLSRLGIDALGPSGNPSLELFDSTLSGDGARRIAGVDSYGVDLDIRGTKIRGFEGSGVRAGYLIGKVKNSVISGNGGPGIDVFDGGLAVRGSAVLDNGGPVSAPSTTPAST